MNYEQIQLVEYAFYCATELTTLNNLKRPKLVIGSDSDIFTAETFLVNENNSVEIRVPHHSYAMRYLAKYLSFENGNPFFEVRQYVFKEMLVSQKTQSNDVIIHQPELFFESIQNFTNNLDIKHDFEMPKVFHNYQSLLHEKLSMPFAMANQDTYQPLSIIYQSDEPQ